MALGRQQLRIVQLLVKPVVRYCLRNLVSLHELFEAAKAMAVEQAADELERLGEKVTVSKVSVMTGLTRRDVNRLFKAGQPEFGTPPLTARVINRWQQDKRFVTAAGKPKVLNYRGADSEFWELVKSVSKDMSPPTVMFQLQRLGLVQESKNGLRLLEEVSFTHLDPEEGLKLLAQDNNSLIRSVEENIFSPQPIRNLHLRTHFNNIFVDDLPAIRAWFLEKGKLFHREAREFLAQYDGDINPDQTKGGGGEASLTTFSWTDSKNTDSNEDE